MARAVSTMEHCALGLLELQPGGRETLSTGDSEVLVLPLSGSAVVEVAGERFELAGRTGVFDALTDFAYLPRDAEATVSSANGGRFALPAARTSHSLPARYGAVSGVQVELRGAGNCSRQVNNFCTPPTFEAGSLIACEVITPSGNWSSYPPHKHDQERRSEDGTLLEAELEEIYYYEVRDPRGGTDGIAYQRVYGTDDRPIDLLTEVRTGDAVAIPHGWHGPSMAVPGYDLYYLNVMAGPGDERAWVICDDPAHAWVRDTWGDVAVDPRLPFFDEAGGTA